MDQELSQFNPQGTKEEKKKGRKKKSSPIEYKCSLLPKRAPHNRTRNSQYNALTGKTVQSLGQNLDNFFGW
jgi:hypothetical protein